MSTKMTPQTGRYYSNKCDTAVIRFSYNNPTYSQIRILSTQVASTGHAKKSNPPKKNFISLTL